MKKLVTKVLLILLICLSFQLTLIAEEIVIKEENQTVTSTSNEIVSKEENKSETSTSNETVPMKEKKLVKSSDNYSGEKDDTFFTKEVIGGIIALITLFVNLGVNITILSRQKKKESVDMLQKQLHEFYAPMESYLHVSYELSKVFKATHADPSDSKTALYLDDKGNFRTLPYLLDTDKDSLPLSEKMLMEEIISIGQSIEKLIIKQSGLVVDNKLHNSDENEVLNLLTKALVHIRIIRMIYNGKLEKSQIGNDVDNYVFPTNLTEKIQEGKVALQKKLKIDLPTSSKDKSNPR